MVRRTHLNILSLLAVLVAVAVAGCSSNPTQTYDPSVRPLTGVDAAGPQSVKLPDGRQACGVFDVNGHGAKEVKLSDFPDCASASTVVVFCLTGDAQWSRDNVADETLDGATVKFTSSQDGTCGLFPAK